MAELEKQNTVPATNQVNNNIFFEGSSDGAPKVMFIGNSIAYHGIKEEIGWHGRWGMAASEKNNDYVHLIIQYIQNKFHNASFCIVQAACWERSYKDCDYDSNFELAKNFNPDIIICNISENIQMEDFDKETFKTNLRKLHTYLSGNNKNVKILQATSFFNNEVKTRAIEEYGQENGITIVNISDISKHKKNLAYEEFEHKGIQVHPNDLGMKCMAELFINQL